MKKPFLLLLSFIPLLASCNNKGSFPNPFTDDTYKKIGFTIDEANEQIARPLTNAETNAVLNTINPKAEVGTYDKLIYSMESKRETRDYTRAFAGEFKQGYNVKNVMKEEKIKAIRQDEGTEKEETGELKFTSRARTKISNESSTTSQYSYGTIKEDVNQEDYIHFKATNSQGKYDDYTELDKDSGYTNACIGKRTKKIENKTYTSYDDQTFTDTEVKIDERNNIVNNFYINQSQYISAPDLKSGADKSGNIILVKASQNKHNAGVEGKEGVFELNDGRRYQAMDNSLTVTKLAVKTNKTEEKENWCLVSYVRIYKETVITSEVIQPNVQVTKLKNPITISYSEEIANFYNVEDGQQKPVIDGKLPMKETKL